MTEFSPEDRLLIARAGLEATAAAFPADVAYGLATARGYRAALSAPSDPMVIAWPFGADEVFAHAGACAEKE